MKTMFVDCRSCGTKFDWVLSQEEPQCERCKVIFGIDPKKIIAIMGETKVPGQRELLRVLGLLITRFEKIEDELKTLQGQVEAQSGS